MSLEQKVKYSKKIKDAARAGLKVFSIRDNEFPYSRIGVEETEIIQSDESCVDYLQFLNFKLNSARFAEYVLDTVDAKRKLGRTLLAISIYHVNLFDDVEDIESHNISKQDGFISYELAFESRKYLQEGIEVYSEILGRENIKQRPEDFYMFGTAVLNLSYFEHPKKQKELLKLAELAFTTAIKTDIVARPKYYFMLGSVYDSMTELGNQTYEEQINIHEKLLESIDMMQNLRKVLSDKYIYANALLAYSEVTHDVNYRFYLRSTAETTLKDYYSKTNDEDARELLDGLSNDQ